MKPLSKCNPIIYLLLLTLILQNCNNEEYASSSYLASEDYSIEVIDSILIDYNGSFSYIAKSPSEKRFLFFDSHQENILIINDKGKILNQWKVMGEGPENIGTRFNSGGFIDEESFVLSSEKGYFFFDISGHLLDRKYDKETLPYTFGKEIYPVEIANRKMLIHEYKSFPDMGDGSGFIYNPNEIPFPHLRFITFFDIEKDSSSVEIGLPKDYSFIKKNHKIFSRLYTVNKQENTIEMIFTPEHLLHIYSLTYPPKKIKTIPLNPSHFGEIRLLDNTLQSLVTNGAYLKFYSLGNTRYIQYKARIDPDLLKKAKSLQEINALTHQYGQLYLMIFKDDKKIVDIPLPDNITILADVLSNDFFLCFLKATSDKEYRYLHYCQLKKN